ncbi:MAG: formylmethanofuran dehydrogenase subunit B [Planctomycetota bacterium]|nr:MAG: formylmethanofuran dehydrogenase subunit B [Planctomycetota bacterium]REJ97252.1 MAG: formylmethanofuran dehydrogenase subunit B [Planctomycetota bacterium]REK22146.1 MAG: formylmethanofuran dehydrogenase subunit B [Planctomycetota bacterium]REK34957.1 MAG: formylmethanofuran dehydrogenase subunit B [Planctomycetota bacterium]
MSDSLRTITDVACTVCGCVCDDLEFDVSGERITQVRRACELAEPWLLSINGSHPPPAGIGGEEASFEEAVDRASTLLRGSDNPLIFGLSRSSTQGQRAAVHLAERMGANIDTTASVCHGPSIMAIQQVGESTCSLGEVRQRADLVLFWGANPVVSHPRHFERYSVEPAGEFVPRGRADRTVVVIDRKPTATSEHADLFLQVHPERDFEVIWTLRQLIRGDEVPSPADTGVSLESMRDLAARMTGCRYGVVFFGLGLAQRGHGHITVEALLRLVAELNRHTRFSARRLRLPGDVTGADSVLCWQTGFPFAVNLARDFPRYNPGEYSANELLIRGETDCCLVVGSESTELLSPEARARLHEIPTIVLDYPHITACWQPTVRFTTAVYGVHQPGTAYRMDEIPIPLRRVVDSPYPTDEDILNALLARVGQVHE